MTQPNEIQSALAKQLSVLKSAGVLTLPKGVFVAGSPEETGEAEESLAVNKAFPLPDEIGPVGEDQAGQLAVIANEVQGCTQCPELCANRNRTVFGTGNPAARLVLVGEGPGADEDRVGEPFVGAAGKLLDKILAACQLSRDDVYILNTVKCRPPGNRNPKPEELQNCWPFAKRQLDVIRPEFICCLGSVAARTVLNTQQSVGRLRGQFHSYGSAEVIVTYHPAYLLRTPTAKRHTWDDMKMLMARMGRDL